MKPSCKKGKRNPVASGGKHELKPSYKCGKTRNPVVSAGKRETWLQAWGNVQTVPRAVKLANNKQCKTYVKNTSDDYKGKETL